jgi:tyrosyl-tRNA synthetase
VSVGDLGLGPHRLPPLLVKAGLAGSNSEATRKIREGAVAVNGEKVTDVPLGDVKQRIQSSPRDAKIALAKHVISWLHSPDAADAAEADFVRQFVKHEVPEDMPEVSVGDLGPGPHRLPPLLVKAGLAGSNSEATRKIKEGAVAVNGEKVTDVQQAFTIAAPTVLKLGRKYARITP